VFIAICFIYKEKGGAQQFQLRHLAKLDRAWMISIPPVE
jgi:hypothetical protein